MNKMMRTNFFLKAVVVAFLITTINVFSINAQRRQVVRSPQKAVVVRAHKNNVKYTNRHVIQPVRELPRAVVVMDRKHSNYYYNEGRYYQKRPEGYVVVRPRAGVVVNVLPSHVTRFTLAAVNFIYAEGVFYRQTQRGYKTVDPPAGAQVDYLPADAQRVIVEGKVYYELDGTLYKKVETEDGFTYEVSGSVED
jgi:hypothetical protein